TLPATSEIYTLSLHDALPIWMTNLSGRDHFQLLSGTVEPSEINCPDLVTRLVGKHSSGRSRKIGIAVHYRDTDCVQHRKRITYEDRKSTRLNSSHVAISYAVF